KPLGYLSTVEMQFIDLAIGIPGWVSAQLRLLEFRGLTVIRLPANGDGERTFVYDEAALQKILTANTFLLRDAGLPVGARAFVAHINTHYISHEAQPTAARILATVFGDQRWAVRRDVAASLMPGSHGLRERRYWPGFASRGGGVELEQVNP